MTEGRRALFESYAAFAMANAGVRYWDVHAFSMVGDNRPTDMVHADGAAVRLMNLDLVDTVVCEL